MDPLVEKMTIPELHKGNNILWYGLMFGATSMMTVLLFMTKDASNFYDFNGFTDSIFMPVAAILTIATAFMADFIIKKRLAANTSINGLKEKLTDFRTNFVFNAAMHEGPTIICTIFMFWEQNIYFLLLAGINIFLLFLTRPTLEKFKSWYQMTSEEKQEFKSAFPHELP